MTVTARVTGPPPASLSRPDSKSLSGPNSLVKFHELSSVPPVSPVASAAACQVDRCPPPAHASRLRGGAPHRVRQNVGPLRGRHRGRNPRPLRHDHAPVHRAIVAANPRVQLHPRRGAPFGERLPAPPATAQVPTLSI